jgi:uncharacterized protein (DUF427 family)
VWNGAVLAQSGQTIKIEMTSVCPWKGTASYYHVTGR